MAEFAREIGAYAEHLKKANSQRDQRMRDVYMVRTGRSDELFAGLFPQDWSKPVVANTIDVVAQDLSESVGTLPTFAAAGDSILDESKRSRADKLTKVVNFYVHSSNLGLEAIRGSDRFITYGFIPIRVEPHYEEQRPHITFDDPMGTYYEKDRFGRVSTYCRIFRKRASELAAMFPEYASIIQPRNTAWGEPDDPHLDVVRWWDDEYETMLLPDRDGLVLARATNHLGRIPVSIAERPGVTDQPRGAFDDILWVWAAKAKLALLSLEAAQKSVEAPIALPQDVQELSLGPDSIIRSQEPEKIRRISLEMPNSTIMEGKILDDELKFGSRFPEVRAGVSDSSIVTGKGVQALQGGFDNRVKTLQVMLGAAMTESLSMALELDEKIWPSVNKTVESTANGTPYELRYTPKDAIRGNYRVNYEYGVTAGMDPNRALVWSLQGLGAGLFSKSFVRRQLPVSMDVLEEEKIMDVERLRSAALASVEQYAAAIPALAAEGGDPMAVVQAITEVIEARKKGTPIEEALAEAFEPEEVAQEEQADALAGQVGQEAPFPEVAGMPNPETGAAPTMQQLLSGLRGDGSPTMAARTMTQRAV